MITAIGGGKLRVKGGICVRDGGICLSSRRNAKAAVEEVVACMLGGFGIPSEIGIAAFHRVKSQNLIRRDVTYSELLTALSLPLELPGGKSTVYRFYNQKARYLFDFLSNDNTWNNHSFKDATEFRSWLLKVKGIGPKTASWIARNFLESDQVAILDIHLIRAFQIMKVFPLVVNIDKDYFHLEALFLDFCQALEVRPSVLDAVIWGVMKQTNRTGISILNQQFK
ncbi:MAG: 8-oxoguanine DNA glycosylase [Proteobacteria bacterium]|nr:MAG: 8-oxoguanine DNA glycosylase [Pseudomonadota bacterium]